MVDDDGVHRAEECRGTGGGLRQEGLRGDYSRWQRKQCLSRRGAGQREGKGRCGGAGCCKPHQLQS